MYIKDNINQKALVEMVKKVKTIGYLNQFAISKDGETLVNFTINPYEESDIEQLFSLSKTFTSMAVGKACDEGLITLDTKLIDVFSMFRPEKLGRGVENLKVKHLLSMSTGHSHCVMQDIVTSRNVVEKFLSLDLDYEPGTVFVYNNGASLVLSFMITILTNKSLVEYLKPLFEALDITNYYCDQINGVCIGAAGMHLNATDILKFGNFLLNKGVVNGKSIISSDYIEKAIQKHSDTSHDERIDWHQGYGYHLWMGEDSFRCDGMLGQYAIVYPKENIVIACISNVRDMQKELDFFKEFKKVMFEDSTVMNLQEELNNIYPVEGKNKFDILDYKIDFEENVLGIESLEIINNNDSITLSFKGHQSFEITSGYKKFIKSEFIAAGIKANVFVGMPLFKEPVIVSSYYLYDNNLEVIMHNHNTPLTQKVTIDFETKEVIINNKLLKGKK